MGSEEALDPLQLLQEELKGDDYEMGIAAINKLTVVAGALGPDRTRAELLPYLMDLSDSDNDEALTSIGNQLGKNFIPLVGGIQHILSCLPVLKKLCGQEEVVVRDAAVGGLKSLLEACPHAVVAKEFVPLVLSLSRDSWFAMRVSATGMVTAIYKALLEEPDAYTTQLEELRTCYTTLASDETPMVRRAVYLGLGEYSKAVKTYFETDILPIMKTLTRDPADTMRLLIVDVIVALKEVLDEAEFEKVIVPLLEVLEDDTSWRVRMALVKKMAPICQGVTTAAALKSIIPLFVKLMEDKESEVRQAACKHLAEVAMEVKGSDESLASHLEHLSNDGVEAVRLNLARSIIPFCKHANKDRITKVVLPIIRSLAKDENYEVRSQIISDVDKLSDYLNPTAFLGLFPLLMELSKDAKWRVRASVIQKCSVLAKQLGPKKFEKQLQPMIVAALSDHVYAIREEACEQVGKIVAEFGGKWAAEKFFPAAFAIYDKNTNYLYRMTCLLFILKSAEFCSPEVCEKTLLPVMIPAGTDDVANVRIQFSKTVNALIPKLGPSIIAEQVTPVLKQLAGDPDKDVQYFSRVVLEEHSLAPEITSA